MPTRFRRYDPEQPLLLPPDLREWLPDNHLAHHIRDIVERLDLSAFYAPYAGDGRRNMPYDPGMMVQVLLYAYATGVVSSRKIARRLHEDVAFRYLAAGNFPSHRTICEFRHRHLSDFKVLFVEVLRIAQQMGVAKVGKIAVDGTKVRANASKRKAMSYGYMKHERVRLQAEIDELIGRAAQADEEEDQQYGAGCDGSSLPEELSRRQVRKAAIEEAMARLEAHQRELDDAKGRKAQDQESKPKRGRPHKRAYGEPKDQAQSNFTDPESAIMKTSNDGFQQCYNAQLAVEGENQIIAATQVTANATDQGRLMPVVEEVEANCGTLPQTLLADAGYANEKDLERLEDQGIEGYIALGREKRLASNEAHNSAVRQRMREKLRTADGRTLYGQRKWLSEAPNGWIKHVLGFRQFSVRGLAKVQGEWNLVCLALNLRRMHGLQIG